MAPSSPRVFSTRASGLPEPFWGWGPCSGTLYRLVTCPSGRRCNTRNVVWCQSQRGFKSHRHRQIARPRFPLFTREPGPFALPGYLFVLRGHLGRESYFKRPLRGSDPGCRQWVHRCPPDNGSVQDIAADLLGLRGWTSARPSRALDQPGSAWLVQGRVQRRSGRRHIQRPAGHSGRRSRAGTARRG